MTKETTTQERLGVMNEEYAKGRITKSHLKYRLRVRAQVALNGYKRFHSDRVPHDVLSMGAAEGATLLYLSQLLGGKGSFDGVEYAESLIQAAPPLPDNVNLLQGDVMDLPASLNEGSYDLCIALAVLEHLSNPEACVREAYRMLRPGGVFVATCPHPFWDDIAGKFGLVKDEYHESEVNLKRMVQMCEKNGFSQVVGEPFMWVFTGFMPYLGVSLPPKLSLSIDRLVRVLRPFHFSFVNQVVIAQK